MSSYLIQVSKKQKAINSQMIRDDLTKIAHYGHSKKDIDFVNLKSIIEREIGVIKTQISYYENHFFSINPIFNEKNIRELKSEIFTLESCLNAISYIEKHTL